MWRCNILGLCWNIVVLPPERRRKWSPFDLVLSLDLYQVSCNIMWKEYLCFVCQHLRYRHTIQRDCLIEKETIFLIWTNKSTSFYNVQTDRTLLKFATRRTLFSIFISYFISDISQYLQTEYVFLIQIFVTWRLPYFAMIGHQCSSWSKQMRCKTQGI
jgi:hypothetical protein